MLRTRGFCRSSILLSAFRACW